jgi:hypothetical protein
MGTHMEAGKKPSNSHFDHTNGHALRRTTNHERKGQHIVLSYKTI